MNRQTVLVLPPIDLQGPNLGRGGKGIDTNFAASNGDIVVVLFEAECDLKRVRLVAAKIPSPG